MGERLPVLHSSHSATAVISRTEHLECLPRDQQHGSAERSARRRGRCRLDSCARWWIRRCSRPDPSCPRKLDLLPSRSPSAFHHSRHLCGKQQTGDRCLVEFKRFQVLRATTSRYDAWQRATSVAYGRPAFALRFGFPFDVQLCVVWKLWRGSAGDETKNSETGGKALRVSAVACKTLGE